MSSPFRCLVISGGGERGAMTAEFLAALDIELWVRYSKGLYNYFDMISSTSVGGIIAGALALEIPMPIIRDLIMDTDNFWKRSYLPWTPRWKRQPIIEGVKRAAIGAGKDPLKRFGEIAANKYLQITSVNLCRNPLEQVFFKSWKPDWTQLRIIEAIQYTFSAAYYFGNSPDARYQMVFGDGGEGNANTPLDEAINSINRLGFRGNVDRPVKVLHVGTGYYHEHLDFNKVKRWGIVREAVPVLMAAGELSSESQIYRANAEAEIDRAFKFMSVDYELPDKKYDALDAIEYATDYQNFGRKLVKDYLQETLDFLQ